MKILCIGAGSMGRRRLRDLTHLAPGNILLYEKSPERAKQAAAAFGVQAYTDVDEPFAQKPDVVTVSMPCAFHEEPVRRAMAGFEQAGDWQSAVEASREISGILAKPRVASAPTTSDFTYESCYLREMRHFLDPAQGKAADAAVTLAEELHDVTIYHAVLHSGETGHEVQIVE